MSATTGLTGSVTSWAGTFNAAMLALLKPATFTLDTSADSLDTTAFNAGAAIVANKIKGLKSWRGQFAGPLATPAHGITGAVSGTAYSTNVQRWSMSLRCNPLDATAYPIASSYKAFIPGLVSGSGSFDAIVDGTTAITEAGASTEPSTGTFTISTGNTLAASLFTTGAQIISRVGDLNVVRYSFDIDGHVTSVGTANIIPAATTLATPVAGALVLTAASGRTYTGSAFWTSLDIVVDPAAISLCSVGFQGSGAITPA